jgi:putative transposase
VSRKTFAARLAQLPAELIARGRGGARAANAVAAPSDPELRNLPAQLPWEQAAIDHYLGDIFLVFHSSNGEVYVERPWITAMIDLRTSYVLAVTMSFLAPSKRAVSKVIRECVRLHARLPNEIIVDRGSEFQSTFMTSLMSHYSVAYTLRPSSHPRFGSQVERLFGEFKSMWLSQRPGNLASYSEARSVDGKCAPKKRAVLFPAQAFRELKEFCGWRNSRMRGISSASADAEFRARQALYPFVAKEVEYDLEFMMVTAVDTKDFQIDQIRGLHINDAWYYAPELAEVRGKKSKVQVRIDPENPYVVYACIKEQWFSCFSTGSTSYGAKSGSQQLSEGLLRLETSSLRRQVRNLDDEALCRFTRAFSADAGSSPGSFASAANNETAFRSDGEETGDANFNLASLMDLIADDLETESWSESYD